ncbi:hydrolase [Haladaptatus sp. R4]|uniref:metal-dependent hydrolase n=1 Tax=Haladaptatus sp. R4 TaxID=1679489 RepID=UPI0007B47984|nr:metal-dependent hydrolase [Haladaptatus sp. R4]KZN26112.1 hydrolase [Haladaptatus sp. R4]
MNPLGHFGIVLFVFGFVTFGLVTRDKIRAAKIVTVAALAMGIAPDIDLHMAQLSHRGLTHTLWAALLAGGVLAFIVYCFEPLALDGKREESFYGFVTGFGGVCCHLAGDVITPMGIKPLYPVLKKPHTFNLVYANNGPANIALLVVGILTFQLTVRQARKSDSIPAYDTGFDHAEFRFDSESGTDVET